jgi:hypothetical protein
VPQEHQGGGRRHHLVEPVQHRHVARVRQPPPGLLDVQPGNLVDLFVGVEAVVAIGIRGDRCRRPVVHHLGNHRAVLAYLVALQPDRWAEPDPQPGLLLDLAGGAGQHVLAGIELALRQ